MGRNDLTLLCCVRSGRWKIADPNGVECPFCGLWHNVAVQQCTRCHAWLKLPTYHTRPAFMMARIPMGAASKGAEI